MLRMFDLSVPREDAIAYICPVCFWENDVFVTSDDEPSDENHGISLRTAQENYRSFGACVRARCSAMSESRSRRNSTIEKRKDLHLTALRFFMQQCKKMCYSPKLYGAAQAHLAVQRGVDGLDQRLAVAVECTAEGKGSLRRGSNGTRCPRSRCVPGRAASRASDRQAPSSETRPPRSNRAGGVPEVDAQRQESDKFRLHHAHGLRRVDGVATRSPLRPAMPLMAVTEMACQLPCSAARFSRSPPR